MQNSKAISISCFYTSMSPLKAIPMFLGVWTVLGVTSVNY